MWEYFEHRQSLHTACEIANKAHTVWRIYQGGFVVASTRSDLPGDQVYYLHHRALRDSSRESFKLAEVTMEM